MHPDVTIVVFAPLSLFSPHILMLISPLCARRGCGGQASSNLSQMSLKNTGPLRRLLSPLTGRPVASLCNQEADLCGLTACLH